MPLTFPLRRAHSSVLSDFPLLGALLQRTWVPGTPWWRGQHQSALPACPPSLSLQGWALIRGSPHSRCPLPTSQAPSRAGCVGASPPPPGLHRWSRDAPEPLEPQGRSQRLASGLSPRPGRLSGAEPTLCPSQTHFLPLKQA